MNYDSENIAHRYDAARAMPPATLDLWMRAIAHWVEVDDINHILDVGCGTGRFTVGLATHFKANVIGIDPSNNMLARAVEQFTKPSLRFYRGHAEDIPVSDKSIDLIFLSMVYHHLLDPHKAIQEFYRVLRPGGVVCVRNTTVELLDEVPYMVHFPSAREYGSRTFPRRKAVIEAMESQDLMLLEHKVVEQQFAATTEDYSKKIRMRGLSDLVAISDDEFLLGVDRLEASLSGMTYPIVEPIDLLIFEKRPNQAMESDA